MHILFLCQLVPYPLDSGPKVRAFYTLKYLSGHHHISLVAFSRQDDNPENLDILRSFCNEVYTVPLMRSRWRDIASLTKSIFKRRPFVIERDTSPEMTELVKKLLREHKFDAIHADQLWMAQYVPENLGVVKKVLDEHNACFQVFQRLATNEKNPIKHLILEREWRSLKNFESESIKRFDAVVTVTNQDKTTLEKLTTGSGDQDRSPLFTSIPICVDTTQEIAFEKIEPGMNILHLGTMFWLPNVEGVLWFAQRVFPLVKKKIPQVSFTIVGKNPPPEVRALGLSGQHTGSGKFTPGDRAINKDATIEPVEESAGETGINVTGYVNDPFPYIQNAAVFIIPLLSGSGMRVKILDAWNWGVPVVSTTIGAEGIDYQDGENILIADEAEDFADAVCLVLQDPSLARFLIERGRNWVEEKYNWRRVYPAWDRIYPRDGGEPVSIPKTEG